MTSKWVSVSLLWSASLAVACTPEQTTPPVTSPKTTATTTAVAVAAEDVVDLTPVAAPKSVFLVMRALRPKQTLETVQKLGKLPSSLQSMLDKGSKGATAFVDFSEPADLVLAIDPATRDASDPSIFMGFSIPLQKSFEGLLDLIQREGDEVREAGPGHYRIRSKKMACEIAVPKDRAARIVCADSTAAYRELGPFIERTLPTQPKPAADVSLLLDFAPVNERLLPLMRNELDKKLGDIRGGIQSAGVTDPELLDAPAAGARELTSFIEDLDRAEVALAVDPNKPEGSLRSELFFRENKSWATRVLTKKNGLVTQPPEGFWRMPKDADTAMFGHAADSIEFAGIRRVFKKGVLAGLQFTELSDADKTAIGTLIDSIPSAFGSNWAYAGGSAEPLKGGAAGKPEAFTPQQAIVETKNRVRSVAGWTIVTGEGDVAQMTTFFKNGADVYGRVVKHLKAEATKKGRSRRNEAPKVTFTANPPGMPKGSAALDMDIAITSEDVWNEVHPVRSWDTRPKHPNGKGAKGTIELRMLAMPSDGGGFVWGLASDKDLLKQKLLATQKTAKPDEQLSARADLARLRKPLHGGGFVSPGRLVRGLAEVDKNDSDSRAILKILDAMPNKGKGLVFVTVGGLAGSAPSVSFEMAIDKPWVEDIGSTLPLILREMR